MENNVLPDGDLDFEVEANWTRPGLGTLYRVTGDETVAMRHGMSASPTPSAGIRRDTRFYFGDTLENEIRVYDFDAATGAISNGRPFFAGFERGRPDGSIIDSEGCLWNCRFGGGCVVRLTPDGEIDRIVELPCTDVTTCTFGGPDLRRLYITSAMMRLHKGERLAGALFSLNCEAPGLPEHRYRVPGAAA